VSAKGPERGHPGPSGKAAKNEMCYGVAGNTNLLGPNSSQVVMNQNIRFCPSNDGVRLGYAFDCDRPVRRRRHERSA